MINQQKIHLKNVLYRRLLSVSQEKEPGGFLAKILELFVLVTGACQGYLELSDSRGNIFWVSQNYNARKIQNIREAISKGIIAEVLRNREVVQTFSALSDPRFNSRESVRSAKIEAVLCVPIQANHVHGVIYLQGRESFKADMKESIRDARLIVDHITPLIEQIYYYKKISTGKDHTAYLREKYDLNEIIGGSKALEEVLKTALMVAPLDLNILLTGDSGTGKTQFAKMIHQNSSRKKKPFVALNCAALPETLMENELFGSVEGGHSSAMRPVQGKVAAAEQGTLFLDEIGELPITVQAKLLHLLESGSYYPLGASKPVTATIRIITATNIDLKKAVKEKRFREDLYYRINVFSIHMPPLSQRGSDLTALAKFFCKETCKKHGFREILLSPSVFNILHNKTWKGNIRELKHTIEAATVYASLDGKKELTKSHFFPEKREAAEQSEYISNFKEATKLFQQKFLQKSLQYRDWNVSRTAKDLSLSRSQLNNLINAFQLKREGQQHPPESMHTPFR